ncbi:MAG: sulfurtransferase TusA family protein [Candidatus Promineofilum sp.]|nr:sulfurtransferase TusA family protein [Promineifilum sp.]
MAALASVPVEEFAPDQTLDNRGSDCASGFVKLLEMMETVSPGGLLAVISSDPASRRELRDWTARAGHQLLDIRTTGPLWRREYRYLIRKEDAHG